MSEANKSPLPPELQKLQAENAQALQAGFQETIGVEAERMGKAYGNALLDGTHADHAMDSHEAQQAFHDLTGSDEAQKLSSTGVKVAQLEGQLNDPFLRSEEKAQIKKDLSQARRAHTLADKAVQPKIDGFRDDLQGLAADKILDPFEFWSYKEPVKEPVKAPEVVSDTPDDDEVTPQPDSPAPVTPIGELMPAPTETEAPEPVTTVDEVHDAAFGPVSPENDNDEGDADPADSSEGENDTPDADQDTDDDAEVSVGDIPDASADVAQVSVTETDSPSLRQRLGERWSTVRSRMERSDNGSVRNKVVAYIGATALVAGIAGFVFGRATADDKAPALPGEFVSQSEEDYAALTDAGVDEAVAVDIMRHPDDFIRQSEWVKAEIERREALVPAELLNPTVKEEIATDVGKQLTDYYASVEAQQNANS